MGSIIALLFYGFLSTILLAEETAKSDLQLISKEFRIVSRVINAISLQASIIKKEIEDRAFMAEILQIDNESLNSIVSVHFDNAVLSEVKRMSREIESVETSKNKSTRVDTKQLLEAFLFLNKTDEILATMRDSMNYSTEYLFMDFVKFGNEVVLNNRCYDLDILKFRNFTIQLMQDAESRNGDVNKTIGILSGFHHQFQIFRDCLKNMSTIQDAFNTQSETCEKRRIFKPVMKNIQLILNYKKYLSEFSGICYHFEELLKKAEGLLNVTSHRETEVNTMTEAAMEKILQSFEALKHHNENHSSVALIYTPGFEQANDMLRVFDDLKSPWFLRKVARNETAEHLGRALQSFKHTAESMVSLQLSWREFVNKTRTIGEDGSVSDGVREIAMIKKFQYFYPDYFTILNISKIKVPECLKRGFEYGEDNSANTFINAQKPREAVCSTVEKIKESVSIMNSYLLETGNEEKNLLSFIANAADRIVDISKGGENSTNAVSLENLIYEKLNETGIIFKMIEEVALLLSNMQILKENVQKDPPKLSLEVVKFDVFLECFQKNVDAWKMYQILQTYLSILDFPSADALNKTNEYLKDLAVFQQKLAEIEKILEYDKLNHTINDTSSANPVLAFDSSITETVGTSVKVLEDLDELRNHRQQLLEFKTFEGFAYRCLRDSNLLQWANPEKRLRKMLNDADEVNLVARNVRNKTLIEMCQVFEVAARIEGILGSRQQLYRLVETLENGGNESGVALNATEHDAKAAGQFRSILNIDLEISKHHSQLKRARSAVISLTHYFDGKSSNSQGLVTTLANDARDEPIITLTIAVYIGIAIIFILLMVALLIYGRTEKGRIRYKNIYLRYLKAEDGEKLWRYSAFMDNQDGVNLLLKAAGSGDEENLLKALKNGAYVNAYNKSGNTALHVATENGSANLVEHLINHGANRSLLNVKNKTAEEMIPLTHQDNFKEEMYKNIHKIYTFHSAKTYPKIAPQTFPVSCFRIYTDESIDDTLKNNFLDQYPGISSDKVMDITTHVIAKTSKNGHLITNRLDLLYWIFKGAIIMQEKWMSDCLLDETTIEFDTEYMVETVLFKRVFYNTVLSWSNAIAKASIPYLYGVYAAIVIKEYKNLSLLSEIITSQGGTMLKSIPDKEKFNVGSHPYLHAHLGPLFLIHDETSDLKVYKNDEMYTLFTEKEFISFMLKREINRDESSEPIPVLK